MFTIVERENRHIKGMGFDEFVKRFDAISQQLVEQNRAKAFAFIFYDFNNASIKDVVAPDGGFLELDRLSAKDVTVFYFHTNSSQKLRTFNEIVINSLGLREDLTLPCIVFFKVKNNEVDEIKVVELIENDYLSAFRELYSVIKSYINEINKQQVPQRNTKTLLPVVGKIAIEQFFKVIFDNLYKRVL
jgi:hypothetical protein